MVRLAVIGAGGRLGRRIVAHALRGGQLTLVAGLGRPGSAAVGVDLGLLAGEEAAGVPLTDDPAALASADVVIDVSLPGALPDLVPFLTGRALVRGVTGGADEGALATLADHAPVLQAANFSAGVHVLADLVARAAVALPDYDLEVVEAHHRHKRDAPSGTALLLAQAASHARGRTLDDAVYGRSGQSPPRGPEIGIHAVRAGDVVGEHTVWIAGEGERLLLGHVATSRDTFALGALRAARWLVGQPSGAYTMRDALGLSSTQV